MQTMKTRLTRRRFVEALSLAAAGMCLPRVVHANGAVVPLALQSKLVAKVAKYDRNLAPRAQGTVKIHLLELDNAESRGAASRLERAFGHIDNIAGMSVHATRVPFESGSALADRCRDDGASIVFVTPGMDYKIDEIGTALSGVSVLTVGAVPSYVESGTVLGFDLVEGSPKILVHLERARAQQVSFKPALLKLAKIIE
jgi:hypothetical protein